MIFKKISRLQSRKLFFFSKPWKKLTKKQNSILFWLKRKGVKKKDSFLSINDWKKIHLYKPSLWKTSIPASSIPVGLANNVLRVHRISSSRSRTSIAKKRLLQGCGEKRWLNLCKLFTRKQTQEPYRIWNLLRVLETTHPRIWEKMGFTKSVGTARMKRKHQVYGPIYIWPKHDVPNWDVECSQSIGKKLPISM